MTNPFDPTAIDPETAEINANIDEFFAKAPPIDEVPVEVLRNSRVEGKGVFPVQPHSGRAEIMTIPGKGGEIGLRIMRPKGQARGVYLHLHGGGWVVGANDQNDPGMEHFADKLGLAVVSVNYRLAPENPYPAAPDDCEAAAVWLVEHAKQEFGTDWLAIGGESAGGHLSAVTLLRMRDRHGYTGFKAANLVFGVFDLTLTPSVRQWGDRYLVLNTHGITWFRNVFVPDMPMWTTPDASPLYATLEDMPPALFTVGTLDPLLDDTLFMQRRWQAAGHEARLELFPGGPHGFPAFGGPNGKRFVKVVDEFLAARLDASA